jgi:tetratricopeptide (TPR) repeat protein
MKKDLPIAKKTFHLAKEALLASGIEENDRIADYVAKLGQLHQRFIQEMTPVGCPLNKAKLLFDWLWIKKPARYKIHGSYRLSDAIDAQLSNYSHTVGNCLGLTLLYNCLLRRMDITAKALYLENAFGVGPHVLTILEAKGSLIDIENILPEGFNYEGHYGNSSRTIWGDIELISDLYNSLGNDSFEKHEFVMAMKYYDIAITLNPQYEKPHLNKAILLKKMEMERKRKSGLEVDALS